MYKGLSSYILKGNLLNKEMSRLIKFKGTKGIGQ